MIDSNETLMYENGRDVGYIEGYEAGIMAKVEKLEPHPTEAIVFGFDFDKINLDDAYNLFNEIKSKFPNNTVLAIPHYFSLSSCSKDVLENIISVISEIIEEL